MMGAGVVTNMERPDFDEESGVLRGEEGELSFSFFKHRYVFVHENQL